MRTIVIILLHTLTICSLKAQHNNRGVSSNSIKKHEVYSEDIETGGLFTLNYLPTIFSTKKSKFSIKVRLGAGMSDKSIQFPNSILLSFLKNKQHIELGFEGVVISGMSKGKIFKFIFKEGKVVRYSLNPKIGYGIIMNKRITINLNVIIMPSESASKNKKTIQNISPSELSPRYGLSLAYGF